MESGSGWRPAPTTTRRRRRRRRLPPGMATVCELFFSLAMSQQVSRVHSAKFDRIGLRASDFSAKVHGGIYSSYRRIRPWFGLYAHMPLSRAGQFCLLSHDEGFSSSEDSLREENPQISDHVQTLNFRAYVTKLPRPLTVLQNLTKRF